MVINSNIMKKYIIIVATFLVLFALNSLAVWIIGGTFMPSMVGVVFRGLLSGYLTYRLINDTKMVTYLVRKTNKLKKS